MRDYSFLQEYAFKKGQTPHNYAGLTAICVNCKKEFRTELNRIKNGRGKNCSMQCYRLFSRTFRGPKHHRWKGGTVNRRTLMGRVEYKLWRTAVFERDKYHCVSCGEGGYLQADHIKPWALFPDLRYAIDNGRTLCVSCHRKTDTYGDLRNYKGGTA